MDNSQYQKIFEQLKELEKRISALEGRQSPWTQPWFPTITSTHAKCAKCGIDLSSPMGYACPHSDCPCGMGPITCETTKW